PKLSRRERPSGSSIRRHESCFFSTGLGIWRHVQREEVVMTKRLCVATAGLAVALMTGVAAHAQTATQDVKEKTASAAQKTGEVLSDAEITTAVRPNYWPTSCSATSRSTSTPTRAS